MRHGFQALALDETRNAFAPVLWDTEPGYTGTLQQVWFAGSHGDVGGHLTGYEPARPLSNIPLIWMLDHAEQCGLPLPEDWRARYPTDVDAPSVGTFRGWGKLFVGRSARQVGLDASERLHDSATARQDGWSRRLPWVRRPNTNRLQKPGAQKGIDPA